MSLIMRSRAPMDTIADAPLAPDPCSTCGNQYCLKRYIAGEGCQSAEPAACEPNITQKLDEFRRNIMDLQESLDSQRKEVEALLGRKTAVDALLRLCAESLKQHLGIPSGVCVKRIHATTELGEKYNLVELLERVCFMAGFLRVTIPAAAAGVCEGHLGREAMLRFKKLGADARGAMQRSVAKPRDDTNNTDDAGDEDICCVL